MKTPILTNLSQPLGIVFGTVAAVVPARVTRHAVRLLRTPVILALAILLGPAVRPILAGNTWDGGGGDNNFGTGANWSPDGTPAPGTANDLLFGGSTRLTPNNNYTAWDDWRNWIFNSGAGSFTISGNAVDFFGKIENNSANLQTISIANFSFNNSSAELDPTMGDLTITSANIYNNGNTIKVWGNNAKTLSISGSIQHGGGFSLERENIVVLSGSSSYSGTTTIKGGALQFAQGGALTASSSILLGDTTGTQSAALSIIDADGGTTINRPVTVQSGSSGTKTISGDNTSGTNTFSGSVTLNTGVTVSAAGGGTLQLSSGISGSGGLTKIGGGSLLLSAGNSFSGVTTVNGGMLEITGYNGLTGSSSFNINSNATFKLNRDGVFNSSHGSAIGNTRVITVDNATLWMTTNFVSRFGNVTLKNGSIWTSDSGLSNWDALLANTDTGAATVLVTNTSGTSASTMNGSGGIHLQGVQNFNVADVTGDSTSDLSVSMVLGTQGTQGGTAGGINKLGLGTMTLSAANTYSNNTIINAGTLALSGSGSISNSSNIILNASSSVFDVSAVTFTLGAGKVLSGLGTVNGTVNVASGGTVTAGTNNVGNLTLSALTFSGTATNNVRPGAAYLIVTDSNGLTTSGGASSVRINLGAGALAAGTYTLIDYAGAIQGTGFSAFQLGTTPGGLFTYTLVDNVANSSVDLQVEVAADFWTGVGGSEWSTNVLGTKNWKQGGSPKDFVNGDDVIFDDTATGTTTVDISVADVTPASVQFNNSSSNYTLQGSAAIAGSIGLTKAGTGTLTINNTNSFTGTVTISAGTVSVGNGGTSGSLGTNAVANSGTLIYNRSDAYAASNAISGTGSLVKLGAGTVTMGKASTYTGKTILADGVLSITATDRIGGTPGSFVPDNITISNGATLRLGAVVAFTAGNRGWTLGPGGGVIEPTNGNGSSADAVITGPGGLTKTGSADFTLNGANTYSGQTLVSAGDVWVNNANGLGDTNGNTKITGGAVRRNGTLTLAENFDLSPPDTSGFSLGNGGSATLTLNGTLILSSNAAVNVDGGSTMNLVGDVTGAGGLVKKGNGTARLTGHKAYAGNTTIEGGTLALAASSSISNTPVISGASGTTFDVSLLGAGGFVVGTAQTLKGVGTVSGRVYVDGTLAPGFSIGTLTDSSSIGVTFNSGGTCLMEINLTNSPNADKLVQSGGTIVLGGTLIVTNLGGVPTNGASFDLFDGTKSGAFAATNLPYGNAHWQTAGLGAAGNGAIVFTNSSPIVQNVTTGVALGASISIPIISGKHPPTDAEGDSMTVTAVGPASSGTSGYTGTNVTYTADGSMGTNTFTYTVTDALGATGSNTVTVVVYSPQGFNRLSPPDVIGPGTVALTYLGIPGYQYALDHATNLTAPVTWSAVITNTADGNGMLNFTNTSSAAENYFRTRHVP